MATRNLRRTDKVLTPKEAARPKSDGRKIRPAGMATCPKRKSSPCKRRFSPVLTAFAGNNKAFSCAALAIISVMSSWGMTVSHAAGMSAPVIILMHS